MDNYHPYIHNEDHNGYTGSHKVLDLVFTNKNTNFIPNNKFFFVTHILRKCRGIGCKANHTLFL